MGNEFLLDIKEICNTKNILSQNDIKNFRKSFLKFNIDEINNKFSWHRQVKRGINEVLSKSME